MGEEVKKIEPSKKTTSNTKEGLHLKRPCLIVADLEKSLTLYRDILGFRLDYVGEASPQSYLYKVFKIPQQAHLTFAALSTEYEPRALALTEAKGIQLTVPAPPHRVAIVMQVKELADTIQKIQALDLKVIEPSYFTTPHNQAFTEQGFYDFDSHLIVLYEVKVASPKL